MMDVDKCFLSVIGTNTYDVFWLRFYGYILLVVFDLCLLDIVSLNI